MYILLAILLIGLVYALVQMRRNPAWKFIAVALAVPAIALALASSFKPAKQNPQAYAAKWHEAQGYGLAQLIASDFPEGASVLVLDHTLGSESAISSAKFKGMNEGFASGKFKLVVVDQATVERALGIPEGEDFLHESLTADTLARILAEHPGITCIASYLGPVAGGAENAELPPVYAANYEHFTDPPAPIHPSTRALLTSVYAEDFMQRVKSPLSERAALLFSSVRPPFTSGAQ